MLNEIVCILHMQKERDGVFEREALDKSAIHTLKIYINYLQR